MKKRKGGSEKEGLMNVIQVHSHSDIKRAWICVTDIETDDVFINM